MPTLAEALLTFVQVDRSPKTNKQYQMVLTRLINAIGPKRDVKRVTYEDLVDYFAQLRKEGLKDTTRAGYLSVVKAFFTWCVENDYIRKSPATNVRVKVARREEEAVKAVPPSELAAMVEFARYHTRNYAMMLFFVDTGCRVGGLQSLQISNIDFNKNEAIIREKGGVMHRATFGEETAAALKRWLQKRPKVDHDYVWTGQGPKYKELTTGGIAAVVRTLAVRTEASHKWGPHAIRHSTGNAWGKRGVPITITARKLGHTTTRMTARYYPNDNQYLKQMSRRHALAAIQPDEPEGVPVLRVVK